MLTHPPSARPFAVGFKQGLDADGDEPPKVGIVGRQAGAFDSGFRLARTLSTDQTLESAEAIETIQAMIARKN